MIHILKRLFAMLLACAMLAGLPTAFAAEPQNISFYVDMQDYNNPAQFDRKHVRSAASLGDSLYILTNTTLEKWTPGQAEPETLFTYSQDEATDVSEAEPAQVDEATDTGETETAQAEPSQAQPSHPERLASDGQRLYSLVPETGMLWSLLDDSGAYAPTLQCTLDMSAFTDADGNYSYPYFSSMLIHGGTLYLSSPNYEKGYSNPSLHQWDIQTGQVGKVMENCFAQSYTPYKDGLLLCILQDYENSWNRDTGEEIPPRLGTLNPETGDIEELFSLEKGSAMGLAYNPDTNTAYYVLGSIVMSLPDLAQSAKVSAYLNTSYWGDGAVGLLGGDMYFRADYQGCEIRGLDMPGVEAGALTIYGGYGSRGHTVFTTQHPEIPVALSNEYYQNMEEFTNAMVSGQNAVDVLSVVPNYAPFTRLMEKGYALDLSGNEAIMAVADAMYPSLTDYCTLDGKLYALPLYGDATVFGYNPKAWEELGLTQEDVPTTFWELLDFVENWEEDYGFDNPDINLFENTSYRQILLDRIMETYVAYCRKQGEPINFDTPLFTKLMTKLDGIDFESIEPQMASDQDWEEYYRKEALFREYDSCMYFSSYSDAVQLALPLEEGMEPVIPVSYTVVFINPRSERLEQALLYVSTLAQYYDLESTYVAFFPDHNQAIENPSYQRTQEEYQKELGSLQKQLETAQPEARADLESRLEYLEEHIKEYAEKGRFLVTEAQITNYRENFAPYLYVAGQTPLSTWDDQGNNELYTLTQQYMDGALPVDRFIKEISKRTSMMEMEAQ